MQVLALQQTLVQFMLQLPLSEYFPQTIFWV